MSADQIARHMVSEHEMRIASVEVDVVEMRRALAGLFAASGLTLGEEGAIYLTPDRMANEEKCILCGMAH